MGRCKGNEQLMPTMADAKPFFTEKQRKAIEMLVLGESQSETVRTIGISLGTLQKWLRNPAFQNEMRVFAAERENERHEVAVKALKSMEDEALTTLKELLASDNDNVKLKAVDLILRTKKMYEKDEKQDDGTIVEFANMPFPQMPGRG